MMPVIWRPPRPRTPDSPRPQTGQTAQQLKEKEQQQQWWQHTAEYAGYNYVAAFGQYWELACAGKRVRVRAAQLQHRVPCWGYVFEELPPTPAAAAAGQAAQDAGARHAGGAAARGRGRKVRAGREQQGSERAGCSRGRATMAHVLSPALGPSRSHPVVLPVQSHKQGGGRCRRLSMLLASY